MQIQRWPSWKSKLGSFERFFGLVCFKCIRKKNLRLKEGNKRGKSFLLNLGIGAKQQEKDDKNLLEYATKQLKLLISQSNSSN